MLNGNQTDISNLIGVSDPSVSIFSAGAFIHRMENMSKLLEETILYDNLKKKRKELYEMIDSE